MKGYARIVVAGEVDSGKSTLIGRFLFEMGSLSQETMSEVENVCQRLDRDLEFAYLLDSLEEERINQLTIDTTQVFCKSKKNRDFAFIDVPGHKQLLKNMLSGSTYATTAILVVDVVKSLDEGTRRHFNILNFLGIDKIILALNKMDLVGFNEDTFNKTQEEISVFYNTLGIKPTYIIPISGKQGDNLLKKSLRMPWYKGATLFEALDKMNKRLKEEKNGDFYFPIQDVYCINKEKICVGNIISGQIKRGEIVNILPLNKLSKVKKIMVFDKTKFSAKTQDSIGLVLAKTDNLQRGQVIYRGEPPEVVTKIVSKIFCVQPLSLREQLTLKCTTQNTPAKIEKLNRVFDITDLGANLKTKGLKQADVAEVVITTKTPVVIKKFSQLNTLGRFILERDKEICAVGIIT